MNREIKYIVIHSTRTQPGATVQGLIARWKAQEKKPRFHCIIDTLGHAHRLLGANFCTSQFLIRNNENCYHLAYLGGFDPKTGEMLKIDPHESLGCHQDTRTPVQTHVLFEKIEELCAMYPNAEVVAADKLIYESTGRYVQSPGFDVHEWMDFHSKHREQWISKDIELLQQHDEQEKALWYPWEE